MNEGFQGYVIQGEAHIFPFVITNPDDGSIEIPDQLPTYRIYGDQFVLNGTSAVFESGTITGATNASPIVVTSPSHDLTTGALVTISGVTGNTAANGTFRVVAIDSNTFSLTGTTGNGAYASGGIWQTAGMYGITLSSVDSATLDLGRTYTIVVSWTVGAGSPRSLTMAFGVN